MASISSTTHSVAVSGTVRKRIPGREEFANVALHSRSYLSLRCAKDQEVPTTAAAIVAADRLSFHTDFAATMRSWKDYCVYSSRRRFGRRFWIGMSSKIFLDKADTDWLPRRMTSARTNLLQSSLYSRTRSRRKWCKTAGSVGWFPWKPTCLRSWTTPMLSGYWITTRTGTCIISWQNYMGRRGQHRQTGTQVVTFSIASSITVVSAKISLAR